MNLPGFDFRGELISDPQGQKLLGVHLITDGEQTLWFDPAHKALQALGACQTLGTSAANPPRRSIFARFLVNSVDYGPAKPNKTVLAELAFRFDA